MSANQFLVGMPSSIHPRNDRHLSLPNPLLKPLYGKAYNHILLKLRRISGQLYTFKRYFCDSNMVNTRTSPHNGIFTLKMPRVSEKQKYRNSSGKKRSFELTKPQNAIVEGFSIIFLFGSSLPAFVWSCYAFMLTTKVQLHPQKFYLCERRSLLTWRDQISYAFAETYCAKTWQPPWQPTLC